MARLKESVINAFAFGTLGFVLMMCLISSYYVYFLTDVVGIGAAAVGSLLLVARIVDTVSVPVSGGIVEKTNLRWGKYRSWLLIAPPMAAVFGVLMFTDFALPAGVKLMFMGCMYIVAHVFLNLSEVAQFALYPVIATTAEDRVRLSCRRVQVMSSGQILFGLITMPMIMALGGGNEARGFLLTIIVFAVLQVAGFLLMAHAARGFEPETAVREKRQAVTVREMARQIFHNRPLVVLVLAEISRNTAFSIVFSFAVYYFKYVARDMSGTTYFFTSLSAGALLGSLLGQPIARSFAKKTTWVIGMCISCAAMLAAWRFAGQTAVFIAFCALFSVGNSIVLNLSSVLFSDVSDYAEWKTGKNAKGIVMSMTSMPIKAAIALAGGLAGYSLALVGYEANKVPTAAVTDAISSLTTLIPAFLALLSVIIFQFYNLTDEQLARIQQQKATAAKQ
ncbi:MAG TPA: hypothetical protein GX699_00990 [Firmicutes bacterium]|nr:hypothetical protein [Bacillota bacterium]